MAESEKSKPVGGSLADMVGLDPQQFYARCVAIANAAKPIIEDRKLYTLLKTKKGPRKFLHFEAWQMLGQPLGLFTGVSSSGPVEGGYKAHADLKLLVGGGTAIHISGCDSIVDNKEPGWTSRPANDYLSKAGTRAGSKAYRMVIGWLPKMMGADYEATSGEDNIPEDGGADPATEMDPLQAAMAEADQKKQAPAQSQGAPAQQQKPADQKPAEKSTKETRQRLMGMLAVVGFKKDDLKKAAFKSFCPGFESTKDTPEAMLLELEKVLKGVKDGGCLLKVIKDGETANFAIIHKDSKQVLFPKSGPVHEAAKKLLS